MKYFLIFVCLGLFTIAINANSGETYAVLKSFKEYLKSPGLESEVAVRRRRKQSCVRICQRQCQIDRLRSLVTMFPMPRSAEFMAFLSFGWGAYKRKSVHHTEQPQFVSPLLLYRYMLDTTSNIFCKYDSKPSDN
ncbi:hypothetical protein GQX74_010567 [Glossina fuscipes]|nr:hypothetical protein GQX74_010567 [Glossina fuscipes]